MIGVVEAMEEAVFDTIVKVGALIVAMFGLRIILGFFIGYFIGYRVGERIIYEEAVIHSCAGYNIKTGTVEWLDLDKIVELRECEMAKVVRTDSGRN